MASEMSPDERRVHTTTALLAELLPYLEQRGAVVSTTQATTETKRFLDEAGRHFGWPGDWRGHAHVDFLDLDDTE
jgi:hypothetical protein